MKTRDKIIRMAIRLFNENGLSNVSNRQIAGRINISHGNLEYHFPKKESLILAIYEQMVQEISTYYEVENEQPQDPIEHFQRLLTGLEEFQKAYAFFNIDILEIYRKYPGVVKKLADTLQLRKKQIESLFARFITYGYMKNETLEGSYSRLQHTIRILITFWQQQNTLLAHFDYDKEGEFVQHVWELLLPHFTEKGISKYNSLQLQPNRQNSKNIL